MISFYHPANSLLHRLAAGYKILGLLLLGTVLFQISDLRVVFATVIIVGILYFIAKIPLKLAVEQLKPALYLLLVLFAAQYLMNSLELAIFVVLRFAALIMAAGLVTLTTKVSEMVAAIETALSIFSRWVAVEKVSLAISLTIRFIPVIAAITVEVKEAQRVRGMERNIFAVAMPVVIRTLKMATDVAEALDARSFGADFSKK